MSPPPAERSLAKRTARSLKLWPGAARRAHSNGAEDPRSAGQSRVRPRGGLRGWQRRQAPARQRKAGRAKLLGQCSSSGQSWHGWQTAMPSGTSHSAGSDSREGSDRLARRPRGARSCVDSVSDEALRARAAVHFERKCVFRLMRASIPSALAKSLSCTSRGIGGQGVGSLRKEFLCFNTMPCRRMPLLVHF